MTDEWVQNVDRQITDVVGSLLHTSLDDSQRKQVFLRVKDGGLGLGSAELRKEAAWIGAWEGGLHPLLQQLQEILPDLSEGPSGLQAIRERWPQWGEKVDKMERALKQKKGVSTRPSAWDILASAGAQKAQKGHAGQVYENFQKKFHASLKLEDSMEIRLSAGQEAGAFLAHEEGPAPMSNENMRNALRRRLRVAQVEGSRGVCHHARSDKSICGKVFGHDGGRHIMNCKVGGGVDTRHNGVRDALGRWLEEIGKHPRIEQLVPKWNTADSLARLDVALTDERIGQVCVDVSVVASVRPGVGRAALKAIERRERSKHRRYPGAGLYPFVLDVRGRWGREAHAFVQTMTGSLPKAERAAAIRNCRRLISVALQNGIANQFHSAGRPAAADVAVSYADDPGGPADGDDDMHSAQGDGQSEAMQIANGADAASPDRAGGAT